MVTTEPIGYAVIFVAGYPKTVRVYAFPEWSRAALRDRYAREYASAAADPTTKEAFVLWVMSFAEIDGRRLDSPTAINELVGGTRRIVDELFQTVIVHNVIQIESDHQPTDEG